MTHKIAIASITGLLLSLGTLLSAGAEETLWNITFKDLAPDQPLKEVTYTTPSDGPQRVIADAQNTLAGSKGIAALTGTPLRFEKKTTTNYAPSFILKAVTPYTTGVVTTTLDLIFDKVAISAPQPVETLMALPFMNDKGGSDYIVFIVGEGDSLLNVGLAGTKKALSFKPGEVAHLKTILDLDKHTFQIFLNDAPVSDPVQDNQKFSSFLGLTVRDGTAIGGNKGATFTAGIANLVVTHK